MPSSKLKVSVASVLKEGYIDGYGVSVEESKYRSQFLSAINGSPVIEEKKGEQDFVNKGKDEIPSVRVAWEFIS